MNAEFTFSPLLGQVFNSDSWHSFPVLLFRLLVTVLLTLGWVGALFGSILLIHFFFTLPLRRAERARLFLELLEGALKRGMTAEEMIFSVAQSRDQTVGLRFHLLAAYIESGVAFRDALEKVPRFLPPQVSAMLRVGEKLGDIKKILPACHEILRDHPAGVRSAVHYLILVILFFSPVFVSVVMMTTVFVIPKFRDVAAGMGTKVWPLTQFVFGHSNWLIGFEITISMLMAVATLIYIGGPQFVRWFQFRGLPFVDWAAWRVPWKQKRLQRTFSAMLAVLLDGGVPEAEAVRLAGDSTANEICRRRAQRVIAALGKGMKLDDAIRMFDDAGEFRWRLTNSTHAHGGFLNALRGWHEALDAKAFQQEEATAHIVTTGLVVLNGALVALIATAMFGMLIMILKGVLDAT
jgi:type II secretory pathway component PulF